MDNLKNKPQLKILILDDDHLRHNKFEKIIKNQIIMHVFTSTSCIKQLQTQFWDVCFLDHDLGGKVYVDSGKDTGYEVAKWLEDNSEYIPGKIIIHSLNAVGSENMNRCLPNNSIKIPFPLINEKNINSILGIN